MIKDKRITIDLRNNTREKGYAFPAPLVATVVLI